MRKRKSDPLPAFKVEIGSMNLDELTALRFDLGREHFVHVRAANLTRRKLDTVKAVIFERKHGGDIGISDHAVLRYLERHKGLNVRAVRDEIQTLIASKTAIKGSGGHYSASDGVTLVIPQGSVVATILGGSLAD